VSGLLFCRSQGVEDVSSDDILLARLDRTPFVHLFKQMAHTKSVTIISACLQCSIQTRKKAAKTFTLTRRVFFSYFWKAPPLFGGAPPPPPPKLPFLCSHQDKKGTNLLLFLFCIHLHTHLDLKLKCCRVMGQKLRYGRPCTHVHQAPTTGLHGPTLLPFLHISADCLMLAQSYTL
jgi:hypothetical protein